MIPWIHDCWFDVSQVDHDAAAQTLAIPYRREAFEQARSIGRGFLMRRRTVPSYRWWLRFSRVRSFRLRETEGVGIYDFDEVVHDEPNRRILITTNIPLQFEIHVEAVHVQVESSDELVSTRTVFGIGWPSADK